VTAGKGEKAYVVAGASVEGTVVLVDGACDVDASPSPVHAAANSINAATGARRLIPSG